MSSRHSRNRSRYPVFIELGLVASLLIVIGAFRANYTTDDSVEFVAPPVDVVPLVPVPPTDLTPKPPPPPVPQVPIVVPDDEVLEDDVIEINPEIHPDDPPPVVTPPSTPAVPIPGEIFIVVEDYPKAIGGERGIMERVVYPEIARKAGIEGRVTIQFVVETDGTVSDAWVLQGIGGGCDEAALQAIRETRFTPGMQRKKPVRVKMSIPILFQMR